MIVVVRGLFSTCYDNNYSHWLRSLLYHAWRSKKHSLFFCPNLEKVTLMNDMVSHYIMMLWCIILVRFLILQWFHSRCSRYHYAIKNTLLYTSFTMTLLLPLSCNSPTLKLIFWAWEPSYLLQLLFIYHGLSLYDYCLCWLWLWLVSLADTLLCL